MNAEEEATIIAHRGASEVAPENTKASIQEAVNAGAKVIEFDVRRTADGNLVLFHDDNFERLTGRKGSVETNDWKVVRELDVGSWFNGGEYAEEKPILLSDAIRLCHKGDCIPLIEHKSGTAEEYIKEIDDLEVRDRVILQSFDWDFLAEVRKVAPDIAIGALGSKEFDRARKAKVTKLKPEWVGWNHNDFRPAWLKWLKERDIKIALWTVNEKEVVSRWIEAGVDGIITDRPAEMLELLSAHSSAE